MSNQFSFKTGYMQLKQKDAPAVKAEIMNGLGLTTRMSWHIRLNGKIQPKQSEKEYIETVFKRYGIIDIWGDMTSSELKDRVLHVKREVQELVHFAYLMLGYDGIDRVISQTSELAERIKSGELSIDKIVTD